MPALNDAHIRRLTREEIEPFIPTLIADGFTPEIDEGTWLGAFVDGDLAGFVRVFDEGGHWMLEDVMVFERYRRRGLATALIMRAREPLGHLWLICDDPMVGYYEGLGFVLAAKPDFPEPLATLYAAKKEWPAGSDHNHNAMRWDSRA
jgi:GNAT superfamily N-acetyltransferase